MIIHNVLDYDKPEEEWFIRHNESSMYMPFSSYSYRAKAEIREWVERKKKSWVERFEEFYNDYD